MIAAYYEHGWRAPKISSQDAMREVAEEKIRAFFDEHDLDFGISAEILLMHELGSNPAEALPMIKKAFLPAKRTAAVS